MWTLLLVTLVIAGCDRSAAETTPASTSTGEVTATAAAVQAQPVRIVFLGDSLTAGYGLPGEQAFPALLEAMLREKNLQVTVVNAGISGDTTAGGLRRIDWLLKQQPDIVVVGLGANDGLRATELETSAANLDAIVEKSQAAGAKVLLLGMLIPPNYGLKYANQFRDLYPKLAKERKVALVPFLLEGVAGNPLLNLGDGIHPNAEGQRIVARNVLPELEKLVRAEVRER